MIQSIKGNNLKIVLTREEMLRLFGESTIDINSEKTGKVMEKILNYSAKKMHFKPNDEKIVIEMFEKPNGSCIIYFIGVCQNEREAVLEFNSIDDLIQAACKLKNMDFSCYFYKGNHRIVAKINRENELFIKRMCEFSKINFEREEVARTKEYGVRKF